MLIPQSLKLILLAFVTLSLIYDQATPTFEASDEVWHYAVVRELADGRGLPVWTAGESTTFRQEGGQPPGYYLASAALTFWVDDSDFPKRFTYNPFAQVGIPGTPNNINMMAHSSDEQFPWTGTTLAVRIVRWMSIVLGAVTVVLTYLLAGTLFPQNAPIALLAATFTAFNPTFLFISSSVNNDNGVWLLSSLVISVVALLALKEHGAEGAERLKVPGVVVSDRWMPWILGLLLSLATLTKLSGLVLVPVVYSFLAWRAFVRCRVRDFLIPAAIVALVFAACTGWWFWRNQLLYGELLATRMMIAPGVVREGTASLADLVREAPGWWLSFWGIFGAFNILSARWTYIVYTIVALIAFAGGVFWAWRAWQGRGSRLTAQQGFALLFVCLSLVAAVYWTRGVRASQGRLVMGAIAPMSCLIAAGILGLVRNSWKVPVSRLISSVLFTVALVIPIAYVAPRYAAPAPLEDTTLPSNLISVQATFNDEFELHGYTFDPRSSHPGDSIVVTLYWRGLRQMDIDYNLALNVHGQGYDNISKLDTWPGGGLLPTGDWKPGSIYPDTYEMSLSTKAVTPTVLRLDVSFRENNLADRLPITLGDGGRVSSLTLDVGRLMDPEPPIFAPDFIDGSTMEQGISLLGYDLPTKAAKGETVPITLYWQADDPISADYTVFMHLIDQSGSIVSQDDGPPAEGDWPTSAWQPSHQLADHHNLVLPEELPSGKYSFVIGLYDPYNGTRMSAFTSTGEMWRDSAIRPRAVLVIP